MYLSVKSVKPLPQYRLLLTFENGEEREFDVTPYLSMATFEALKTETLFNRVFISFDTVAWPNGADLDPEILYSQSHRKGSVTASM